MLRGLVARLWACCAGRIAPGIPKRTRRIARVGDRARRLGGGDTGKRMAPTDAVEPLAESPERPIVDLRATLGRGDGFAGLLERAGVAAVEADRVANMVGEVVPASAVRPGTVMDITLGRRPNRMVARPLEKLSFRARFDLRIELARAGGTLHVNQIPIAVDDTPLRIQGRVGDSLYRSARAAGAPAQAVEAYLRALNGQISVPAGIASDDRFDIIIEHRRAATGEVETGDLLYAGQPPRRAMPPDDAGRSTPHPMVAASGVARHPAA